MQFITGNNRHQTFFGRLDDQVSIDNAARRMDAFIDKLDLQKLSFTGTVNKSEGRTPYAPRVLLKLFLSCYINKIRSSRKLIYKYQQFIKDKAEKYLQELDELDKQEAACPSDDLQIKKEKITQGLAKLKERTIKYDTLQEKLNNTDDKQKHHGYR